MKPGMIAIDSEQAQALGFTSDKFLKASYLWFKDDAIYISFIGSKQKGNFKRLVKTILNFGYTVKVPTPIGRMQKIVQKNGYKTIEKDPNYGLVEVWVMEPKGEKKDD